MIKHAKSKGSSPTKGGHRFDFLNVQANRQQMGYTLFKVKNYFKYEFTL